MRLIYLSIFSIAIFSSCQKTQPPMQRPIFQVEIAKATKEDVTLYNDYVGHIKPLTQVQIRAQVEGELLGVFFTEGQEVRKGELLFTIDKRPFVANLQKARASLEKNLANLRYAKDVVKRNAPLAQKDYVSQLDYDQYLTDVQTNQAMIDEDRADIETAKIQISYCNIHAPMDAVSGILQIDQGNLITNAGETPLVNLNQIKPIYGYFSVPQKDLPHIMALHRENSLKVAAFLNGDEKQSFEGILNLIDNQVDEKSGSIWLRATFPNEEKLLWPGEFSQMRLFTEEKKGAILVPTKSISLGQKGSYVFVIKDEDTAFLRYIKVGKRLGPMTIVNKGIKAGETVVTSGQINLGNESKVRIYRGRD